MTDGRIHLCGAMGAILCGLLCAFGIGLWEPENWRASTEVRVVRSQVPECGELAADREFGHLGSIRKYLEPSEFKGNSGSGSWHLRRRVLPDRLYFEVEGPDRAEAARESSRWAGAAAKRLAHLQNLRLAAISEDNARSCARSAMLWLGESISPPNVEALHLSRWSVGFGGGAFFWLFWLFFLIGGHSVSLRRESPHAD